MRLACYPRKETRRRRAWEPGPLVSRILLKNTSPVGIPNSLGAFPFAD
jgi:hypothetical protein